MSTGAAMGPRCFAMVSCTKIEGIQKHARK